MAKAELPKRVTRTRKCNPVTKTIRVKMISKAKRQPVTKAKRTTTLMKAKKPAIGPSIVRTNKKAVGEKDVTKRGKTIATIRSKVQSGSTKGPAKKSSKTKSIQVSPVMEKAPSLDSTTPTEDESMGDSEDGKQTKVKRERLPSKHFQCAGIYWDSTLTNHKQGKSGAVHSESPKKGGKTRRGKQEALQGDTKHRDSILPLPLNHGPALMSSETSYSLPYDVYWHWKRDIANAKATPPPFVRLRRNTYVDVAKPTAKEVEDLISVCDCKPMKGVDQGCCTGDCVNWATMTECTAGQCPMGDKCTNQRFQKKTWIKSLQVFQTNNKGFGVRTTRGIAKDSFVIEYVGEVITEKECKRRVTTRYQGMQHWYFIQHTAHTVIDGCEQGCIARFINHSCQPNCHIEIWSTNGEVRVGIFAARDILPGEELTYDYKYRAFGLAGTKCFCGSANCSGILGEKPKQLEEHVADNRKIKGKKNRRRLIKPEDSQPKPRVIPPTNPIMEKREKERELLLGQKKHIMLLRNLRKVAPAPKETTEEINENEHSLEKRYLMRVMRSILNIVSKTKWNGYMLAKPFQKLPGKHRYADYYQQIKSPICLQDITNKVNDGSYNEISEFESDVKLLVNNALAYNKKKSPIARAVIELQRVFKETIEDHAERIQEVTKGLWTVPSPSANSQPDGTDINSIATDQSDQPSTLYSNSSLLDPRSSLARMDPIQITEVVRCRCRVNDSKGKMVQCGQCYMWQHIDCLASEEVEDLDAVEFKCEICNNVPCNLNIVDMHPPDNSDNDDDGIMTYYRHLEYGKVRYKIGDCVYLSQTEGSRHSSRVATTNHLQVIRIERIWVDASGEAWLYGNYYFRPHETFYPPKMLFYLRELVESDLPTIRKLNDVVGFCAVMDTASYRAGRVLNITEKDTYVVEYKYIDSKKHWKIVKRWGFLPYEKDHVMFMPFEHKVPLRRYMAVKFDRFGHAHYVLAANQPQPTADQTLAPMKIPTPAIPVVADHEHIPVPIGQKRTNEVLQSATDPPTQNAIVKMIRLDNEVTPTSDIPPITALPPQQSKRWVWTRE
eukprot:Ihof_evm7s37 gene=Ihof_evmTU7s37